MNKLFPWKVTSFIYRAIRDFPALYIGGCPLKLTIHFPIYSHAFSHITANITKRQHCYWVWYLIILPVILSYSGIMELDVASII